MTINTITDMHDKTKYYVGMFSDITLQKNYHSDLEYLSHYDSLTNLPNRTLLLDRLSQEMMFYITHKKSIAVIFFDLDGFKGINDSYGVETGDAFLLHLSKNISELLEFKHTFARVGGDEFVIVLHALKNESESIEMIEQILLLAAQEQIINGHKIKISASAGVSFYPQEENLSPEQIIPQAYNSMYQAKLEGKNQYKIFDLTLDQNLKRDFEKINDVRNAIINNEFVLYYQPQVDIKKGLVVGAEALIRWKNPDGSITFPNDFLPAIEYHELSITLGEWVIQEALNQLRIWKKKNIHIPISVNINALHLQSKGFLSGLQKLLEKNSDINPAYLTLEILETGTLSDLKDISFLIQECKKMGVTFSLDDFGTGYSSLMYLKQLRANELRIDQSFIRGMLDDPEDLTIVNSILMLAKTFDKKVVAEGVERAEHAEMLLKLGSNVIQGYCISKAIPAEAFEEWYNSYIPNQDWQNIEAVTEKKSHLLFAKVQHNSWVKNIQQYLNEESTKRPELNPHECRFNRWLQNDGKQIIDDEEKYTTIETLHENIHQLATDIFLYKGNKKDEQVEASLKVLIEKKEQLLDELNALLQA